MTKETELYAPVKAFFEGQGYNVKAEIGPCDVMARKGDEEPLIIELKTGFTLTLVEQGIARLRITDQVYLAIPRKSGRVWWRNLKDHTALCRRLGLGLLVVRLKDGHVEMRAAPGPYAPRKATRLRKTILREFERRRGDPNTGGSTRQKIVTAYRQDALACAETLAKSGPAKGAEVADAANVPNATTMMRDNHYGWFERVERGVYAITAEGKVALKAGQH